MNKHNRQEWRLGWLCPWANEERQGGKKWTAKDNLCKFNNQLITWGLEEKGMLPNHWKGILRWVTKRKMSFSQKKPIWCYSKERMLRLYTVKGKP